jgi:hypothetical protein
MSSPKTARSFLKSQKPLEALIAAKQIAAKIADSTANVNPLPMEDSFS